jgi:hypothetical protein
LVPAVAPPNVSGPIAPAPRNWKVIRSNVFQKAGSAQNIEDMLPAVKYMFNVLNDKHGGIIYKGKVYGLPARKGKSKFRKVLVDQFKFGLPTTRTALLLAAVGRCRRLGFDQRLSLYLSLS